jgi:hypothetical protein
MGIAFLSAGALYAALAGNAFYAMSVVCLAAILIGFAAWRTAKQS